MRIGIIGSGHLGSALIKGLISVCNVNPNEIITSTRNEDKKNHLISEYGIQVQSNFEEVIKESSMIFLVIKKPVFIEMAKQLNGYDFKDKLVISFMSGVTIREIEELLSTTGVIRAMPSISISSGEGVIAHTKTDNLELKGYLQDLGKTFLVDEESIDTFTALSASGLGFASYIMSKYYDIAVGNGLSKEASKAVVENIFTQAAKTDDYNKLLGEVATKDGVTEAGINHLEENHFGEILVEAIATSIYKTRG